MRNYLNNNYITINTIFLILIVLIFLYSAVFSPQSGYPIHAIINGKLASTGLSRAFSELVRGNISKAIEYNSLSLRIFIFFCTQLIMRILTSIAVVIFPTKIKTIVVVDTIQALILFAWSFGALMMLQIQMFRI